MTRDIDLDVYKLAKNWLKIGCVHVDAKLMSDVAC